MVSTVVSLKAFFKKEDAVKAQPTKVKVRTQRYLTEGEIELARPIFKDSINYDKVKIIRGGLLSMPNSSNNAMTPFGSIHLPHESYEDISDFSTALETDQNWFIHEMAHVWQYSLGMSVAFRGTEMALRGGYKNARGYTYDLYGKDKNKAFNEFNFEQQAELISHYFDVVYHDVSKHNRSDIYYKNLQNIDHLTSVLSEFLENPKGKKLLSKNHGGIFHGK